MIIPFMHILSCYDENFNVTPPIDILYLNKQDRELIIAEAKRLGKLLRDENLFFNVESDTGLSMFSTVQSIAGTAKAISPYTSLLLTRVNECLDFYLKEVNTVAVEVIEDDLSTDAVVLRLEGNPQYIYYYVYRMMEMPALSYDTKIAKLKELLITLRNHTLDQSAIHDEQSLGNNAQQKKMLDRLELHSKLSYWREMLMSDYIRYFGTVPPKFDKDTVEIIRKELWDLGFYGFVNPLDMYLNFSNSRVSRKIEVSVENWVIVFLTKIVLSGGDSV